MTFDEIRTWTRERCAGLDLDEACLSLAIQPRSARDLIASGQSGGARALYEVQVFPLLERIEALMAEADPEAVRRAAAVVFAVMEDFDRLWPEKGLLRGT